MIVARATVDLWMVSAAIWPNTTWLTRMCAFSKSPICWGIPTQRRCSGRSSDEPAARRCNIGPGSSDLAKRADFQFNDLDRRQSPSVWCLGDTIL